MNYQKLNRSVIVRYTLFQVPGLILVGALILMLRHWTALPPWALWGFLALWIFKDIVLFPVVWKSYCSDPAGTRYSPVGERGLAREELNPAGRVRIGAEVWNAEAAPGSGKIPAGTPVAVREIRGLTLVVEPLASGGRTEERA